MKKIFTTFLLLVSILTMLANPVDENQARSQALQFLQKHSKAGTRSFYRSTRKPVRVAI